MADDRKLLTADAINLKAKVKAEMQRRSYSGSVAAYGGASYDFTTPPANDGPVLGEHLKKNLEPMQAVNGDGLPVYPGPLTKEAQELMETKIAAWKTRSPTDRSASDCKSGCTGTCYSSCQTGCYTGCSGCSGCGSECATGCYNTCYGCSGCGNGCATTCTGTCTVTCNTTCTTNCAQQNWGTCGSTCSGDCSYGCYAVCANDCTAGCKGCSATCQTDCYHVCYLDCTGQPNI